MAYVPGYEYDVFISYAHVDDTPDAGCETGWVTELVAGLRRQLAQNLGREAIVWMDQERRGNEPTSEILNRVSRSAVIIPILSPGYLTSEWCQRELECFYHELTERDATRPNTRVFPVFTREVKLAERPLKLQPLPGYRFWSQDANGALHRADSRKDRMGARKYFRELDRLSQDLAGELCALSEPKLAPPRDAERPKDSPIADSPIAGPLRVYIDSSYTAEEKGELLSLISELYNLQTGDRLVIDDVGTAEPIPVGIGAPDGGLS